MYKKIINFFLIIIAIVLVFCNVCYSIDEDELYANNTADDSTNSINVEENRIDSVVSSESVKNVVSPGFASNAYDEDVEETSMTTVSGVTSIQNVSPIVNILNISLIVIGILLILLAIAILIRL